MLIFNKEKFNRFWKLLIRLLFEKHIFFNASAITFNLLICSIPFTLILISILGYILSTDAALEELIRYGRELLPSLRFETQSGDIIQGSATLENLIQPLVGARQVFGIIGLIILIFFSQGLFHAAKHVLFQVFDIKDRRHPLMEIVYNFFAFGVIGGVFIFFSMAISLISIFSFDDFTVPYTRIIVNLDWISDWLTNGIPVVFTFLLFYAIYRYISERRISRKVALLGAGCYTLLFELAKFGVSVYLGYALSAYRFYYQGYTVISIIGFWVFYSAALFVVTSVIARAYQVIYMESGPVLGEENRTIDL